MRSQIKIALLIVGNILLILLIVFAMFFALSRLIDKMNTRDITRKTENFAYLNQSARQGQTVFIGDSITEFYPLDELFSNYMEQTGQKVYNRGISAEFSDHLLSRMDDTVLNLQPKILVVLIGTNDIDGKVTAQKTHDNIKALVEKTQKQSPRTKIILQAIYPVNEEMGGFGAKTAVGKRTNEAIGELNAKLETLAVEKGLVYLDLTDILSDSSGNLNTLYTFDGIHPNIEGYNGISREIEKELMRLQ